MMDNPEDIEHAIDATVAWAMFLELNIANTELAKEGLRKFFRKKKTDEMLVSMEALASNSLYRICKEIALSTEDYEIVLI